MFRRAQKAVIGRVLALLLGFLAAGCAQIPTEVAPALTRFSPGEHFRDCPACPEMVVIPGGSFMMGSADMATDRTTVGSRYRLQREKPVHRVTINRPFAIGKYKIERQQFAAFVEDTGYDASGSCHYWTGSDYYETSKSWRDAYEPTSKHNPVVCVSWYDAKAYVAWLSKRTGREYRLPSESEWEYVAHGSADAVLDAKSSSRLFEVLDMTGVAGEWLEDCWHPTYAEAPGDGHPWGPPGSELCSRRVVRGAIWYYGEEVRSPTTRSRYKPGQRNVDIGFRVARTL